jgi:hypothetical protein
MATRKSNTKKVGTKRNYSRKQPASIKDLKVDNFVKNADKPISILVGLLAGSPIAIWIDRQMTAKKVFGMDGNKLKKWVKPGVNFILGMSVNLLAKDQRLKLAGIGLAANGGLIALKELLGGKDLLKGLMDGVNGTDGVGSATFRNMSSGAGRGISSPLNLPLLSLDDPNAEASEMIENAIAEDEREVNGMGGGKEVQIGKTAEQIAGENEPVLNIEDTEMDVIP